MDQRGGVTLVEQRVTGPAMLTTNFYDANALFFELGVATPATATAGGCIGLF
jgi:hypothetical protein